MVYSDTIHFDSEGNWFSLNITENVRNIVLQSKVNSGIVLIFFQHTTGGVLIIEHEAGFLVDLENIMEKLLPSHASYFHHMREYDENGAAHVRSALIPPSIAVPILNGDLSLGEWQDIIVLDMQPETKPRSILIQIVGE